MAPIVTADTYARWRATTLGKITERVETKAVFDLVGLVRGKHVLDIGTGDGTYAIEAAARGGTVTAIDVEPELLEAARRRAAARGVELILRQGRAEALPFESGAFDVVIAVTVLCFLRDGDGAVREMSRVLAPGGRLIIGELARYSVWAAERRVRGWLGAPTWRRARFWSRAALVRLVRREGLRVDQVRGSVFFAPSSLAARIVAPVEPLLTRLDAPGAAFLALAAGKLQRRPDDR